jgi:hypothetical protein
MLDQKYNTLVAEFLEAMNDIGEFGLKKYGLDSFQQRAKRGDTARLPGRCEKQTILDHAKLHIYDYDLTLLHDHFGTLKHQLAAAAFNLMMEFYFSEAEKEIE